MKQTQNALKFLLAQYRAIYKHAYVKGLATAVLLTAGLAAGQAQAASVTEQIYYDASGKALTLDTSDWSQQKAPPIANPGSNIAANIGDGKGNVSGGVLYIGKNELITGTSQSALGGVIVDTTGGLNLNATNNKLYLHSGATIGVNAYGAYLSNKAGNVTATDNGVVISGDSVSINAGGTLGGGASGDVFGARIKTEDGSATATGNSVTINAATLTLNQGLNGIVGALAESTDTTRVIDNHVTISGSGSALSFTGVNAVLGGHALNQTADKKASTLLAQENTVDITNVSFNTGTSGAFILGGRAQSTSDAAVASDVNLKALNNTISLTETDISSSANGNVTIQVVGNFAVGLAGSGTTVQAGQNVTANGNGTDATITITGGNFTNSGNQKLNPDTAAVMGAYATTLSGSATANNNIVDISGASFSAINLLGAIAVGTGAGNSVEATGNKLTITNTSQRTKATDTQSAVTESFIAGAWLINNTGDKKSSLTATNNAVTIKNTSTEAAKQMTIEGTIYGANVQGNTSDAAFTVTGNTVDVGSNIKTSSNIYGASTTYNGNISNNAVTFDGTMQAAHDAAKEIVGAKIVTGDSGGTSADDPALLTVTGNTVTIDSNAVLRNVNLVAVDLAPNNATDADSFTEVIHSGNNIIVNGINEVNDSDGTADEYSLAGDDVTIGANATVYVKNGTLNISGLGNGATSETYYNGTGSADASAKIVNADTINIFNSFTIKGEDSLIAAQNGALVSVNAGKAAKDADDVASVTDEKATLYISQTALANYLTATENKTYSLYDNQTVTDAAGALEVISGGTVDFGATVTLNDFDFASGTGDSIEAGKINVSNPSLDAGSGAYFRADNVVLAHALVTDNSKLKDDLSNLETYKFNNTNGIAIEANVLTLGQSGLSSSQSAAITFGKATVRDEMNFIAATSGQDIDTSGQPVVVDGTDHPVKNDGFHLTSEVIGSHYMQTNTQDGLRTYFTAQSGVIKGPVTIEGTKGKIWIQDGNWTANSNVTVASGGKLTVGSGSAVTELPDYKDDDPTAPDATLVLSGLTLDVSEDGGKANVLVSGNGPLDSAKVAGIYNPAYYADELDTNASWATNRVALLDLTQGLTLKGDANNAIKGMATITATSGGIVLLDADDLNTILAANDKDTDESSGAFFSGSTSGAFIVNGSVTADFGDFGNGSTNGFNLANDGYLVAPSLTVQHANDTAAGSEDSAYITGDSNHVAFGGHVVVDDLQISDLQLTNGTTQNPKPAGAGNYASVVYVDNGTLEIGHSLTSYNHTLALGGNSSSATMNFATDLAADSGEIDVDQIRVDSGSISFLNGKWDAKSTTFNLSGAGTSLTVGGDKGEDADEFDTTATLSGQALIAAAGTKVNIEADGTATFATADFSALAAASNYSGAAVKVAGKLEISDATATTTGSGSGATTTYKLFGAEGSIAIAKNGILSFGKAATNHAIIADNNNYSTAAQVTEAMADGYTKIRNQGGELRLGFADSTTFQAEAIKQLKTELFTSDSLADGVLVQGGVLNIGDASFYGVSVDPLTGEGLSGYTGTWASLKNFSDIYGTDITNDTLKQTNVKEIQAGDNVQGHWGSLSMTSGVASTAQVEIAGDTSLNYAAGNRGFFVSTADRNSALGAHVQGQKDLTLENGGNIGKISLDAGIHDAEKNWTVLNVTGPNLTTIDSIEALTTQTGGYAYENATRVVIEGNTTVTNDIKYVEDVRVYNGATLTAQNVDVEDVEVLNSHLKVNETFTFNFTDVIGGTLEAKDAILNNGEYTTKLSDEDLIIAGSGTFKADTFTFKEDDQGVVLVGLDLGTKGEPLADGTTLTNGTGYFEVGTLDLNGGVLAVDPAYGQDTSVAAVKQFKDSQNYTYEWNDVGVVNGQLLVGKNAALGIGATLDETRAAIAKYQTNGSLSKDDYGSILYLNGQVKLESNTQISLNANEAVNTVEGIRDSLKYNLKAETNSSIAEDQYASLGLGAHTAILMTEQAFEDANGEKTGTAVYFQKKGAVVNANGGEIVLVGAFDTAQKLNFFNDQDNNGIDIVKADGSDGSILVYTQNGFLYTTLTGKNAGYGEYLQVDREHAYATMYEASDPVVESLIAYHTERLPADATNGSTGDNGNTGSDAGNSEPPAGGATGGASSAGNGANVNTTTNTQTSTPSEQLLADNSTSTNGTTGPVVGVGGSNGSDTPAPDDTPSNDNQDAGQDNTTNDTQVATTRGNSEFLDEVVTTSHGAPAEAAARLAIYGGTVQAALGASSTTTDAIAARLGVGSAAGLTIANNGQGATLWVAPVYKSHDSDGFDSQGLDYGVDLNLYGVALGADLELMPGFTAGLMFNVGSGDVDGKGNTAANNTSNDFDYWGAALYGSYRYDALTVAADIGYTVVDNDLEATTGMDKYGKLESSADSTALTFGVTAKYAFDFNTVEVAPHAGLRYTNVDLDDYTVTSNGEDVAHFDAGSISVFSIPVGVTVAKEFQGDNWSVKPMFDLTLTGNFGDDEVDGTVSWTGVDNLTTGVSSEFLDNFTYGATLGVEAKTGSFSFGLGVNYTGSSNADEYGVNANARFVF